MKRMIIFAGVTFCLISAVFLALPFVVSNQNIKTQLDQQILQLTGSSITYKGMPHLTLNPYLGIELADVVLPGNKLAKEDADLLKAERFQFNLQPLSLLFGKIKFTGYKLVRPSFNIVKNGNGRVNWAKAASASSNEYQISADQEIGQFEIIDGKLEARLGGNIKPIKISNLNANINWPTLSSALEIDGQTVWRGEVLKFTSWFEKPRAFFNAGTSNATLSVNSPAIVASFDGRAILISDIQLQGNANISTPSLPRLYELILEKAPAQGPPFGKFEIAGKISANANEIKFEEANVLLDTNQAAGNLELDWKVGKRPKVSGTLAFETLELTPLIETLASNGKPGSEGQNPNNRIPFNLDMRFSAKKYKIANRNFNALAATTILTDDEWNFDIGEADFFGGTIIANISSRKIESGEEVELKGTMRDVSMGDIARNWYGGEIVAIGNTDVNFNLKASGTSALANIREFSGQMNLTLTDGEIDGVDLVKAIPELNKNNGFVTSEDIKGVTPFNNLTLDLLIYNGVGWITQGIAIGGENEIRLSGKADLVGGGLAINADIHRLDTATNRPQRTRIFLGGSVRSPLVTSTPIPKNRADERSRPDG